MNQVYIFTSRIPYFYFLLQNSILILSIVNTSTYVVYNRSSRHINRK